MSLYFKLLRVVELVVLVVSTMIAAFLICIWLFGRESWVTVSLPFVFGLITLVWRVRRIPEFWDWGLTYEQRVQKHSANLSEDRVKSLSADEYEKYKNDTYSKHKDWDRHYDPEGQHRTKERARYIVQSIARGVIMMINSKLFDVVCFVGGPVLMAYGLVSFLSVDSLFIYNNSSKLMIAAGVGLVGFGVVKRMWKS